MCLQNDCYNIDINSYCCLFVLIYLKYYMYIFMYCIFIGLKLSIYVLSKIYTTHSIDVKNTYRYFYLHQ